MDYRNVLKWVFFFVVILLEKDRPSTSNESAWPSYEENSSDNPQTSTFRRNHFEESSKFCYKNPIYKPLGKSSTNSN